MIKQQEEHGDDESSEDRSAPHVPENAQRFRLTHIAAKGVPPKAKKVVLETMMYGASGSMGPLEHLIRTTSETKLQRRASKVCAETRRPTARPTKGDTERGPGRRKVEDLSIRTRARRNLWRHWHALTNSLAVIRVAVAVAGDVALHAGIVKLKLLLVIGVVVDDVSVLVVAAGVVDAGIVRVVVIVVVVLVPAAVVEAVVAITVVVAKVNDVAVHVVVPVVVVIEVGLDVVGAEDGVVINVMVQVAVAAVFVLGDMTVDVVVVAVVV
jgi:hypothetical protein